MFQLNRDRFRRSSRAAHFPVSPGRVLVVLAMALSVAPCFARQTGTIEASAEDESPFSEDLALETFDEAWSIINENHFDPEHLVNIGWDEVREELRPQAAAAADNAELREVIRDMLSRLKQSHFALIPAEAADAMEGDEADLDDDDADAADADADDPGTSPARGAAHEQGEAGEGEAPAADSDAAAEDEEEYEPDTPGTVGLEVRWLDDRLVVTHVDDQSPAQRAGVAAGWIIQSINDRNVASILEDLREEELEEQWFDMLAWKAFQSRLNGDAGRKVTVTFLDGNDEPVELELRREPQRGEPAKFGNLPIFFAHVDAQGLTTEGGHSAGLIAFNVWMTPVMHPVREAVDRFRNSNGIIIDLRGNPGGMGGLSMGVAGFFINEHQKFGTMKTRGGELNFVAFPQRLSADGEFVEPYSGPVALLVDRLTGSASEVFAGGMQSIGRTRVFGTTTMGAVLPAVMPRLANGDVLLHAFGDFVDANGVRMEGRGVIPDEEVHLDRAALLRDEDPVLNAALAWIDAQQAEVGDDGTRGDEVAGGG